jgi:hypothetical protein
MSRFESIPYDNEFPAIDDTVVAIDFALAHGLGEEAGVEMFTFLPKSGGSDDLENLPEGVEYRVGMQSVMRGILVGKGPVEEHVTEHPGSDDHVESMYAIHGDEHPYRYLLRRVMAEFGIGNSQPGHLVWGSNGVSFYPEETHPKTEVAAVVISGAIVAMGGVYAVARHKRSGK